jgi:hypothetical protein
MKDDTAMLAASPGRRAASYWFVDGLPDIVLGVTLLLFGGLGLWWRIYARSPAPQFDFFFLAAGLLLLFWKGREILDFLKSHLTYPRTGYVQPPEELPETLAGRPDTLITLSLRPAPPPDENVTHFNTRTVTVILWWCFLLSGLNPWRRWYMALAMPALAVTLYALNRKSERPFRWWSALILALTGLTPLWLDVPARLQSPLPLLLTGLWLLAQGAFTLVHYLRANPYPRATAGVRA